MKFNFFSFFQKKNPDTKLPEKESLARSNLLVKSQAPGNLISTFIIPEPTKSLLWHTAEDPNNIASPHEIHINIKVGPEGVTSETFDESYKFFSEPSLIWEKLPIERNDELETEKMYYPTYHGLSPKHRFQYLNWLTDVTQDTNLSYVFLYYYGLERHLLIGNYDLAVEETLRLLKHHNKGSFKSYATNALILASGYRKRADILKRAPFIMEEVTPIALYLQKIAGDPLKAKEVMNLASRVGFTNKLYMKEFPKLFESKLQEILDYYESKHGDILQSFDMESLPREAWASIANFSVPEEIATRKFPSVLDNLHFRTILKEKLQETHQAVKALRKANKI